VDAMNEKGKKSSWRIRSASVEDIDRIANFNTQIFRPSVGMWARSILAGLHPTVTPDDFVLIEDQSSGVIAASLALIVQTWLIEGVPIRVGQVEFVGTAAECRGRGLASMGMKWFEQRAREKGCLLGCVQGVPTLYQKLGYHFAVDLKGGVRLGVDQVPLSIAEHKVQALPLVENEYAAAVALHTATLGFLAVRSEMTLPLCRYQEQQSEESEHAYETFGLKSEGQLVGYLRFRRFSRLNALVLRECAFASYPALVRGLAWTAELARERGFSSMVLQLPMGHPAIQIAQTWGTQVISPFAWQVRVFDWAAFLRLVAPVLEQRLMMSALHDLTGELIIHLADENISWCLQFEKGRLASVGRAESQAIWHLKLTQPTLTALVLGYRSRSDLEHVYLETQCEPSSRYMTDVLFPRRESFVYEAY
jgi:GNAT superfamily N-acetyltransferase